MDEPSTQPAYIQTVHVERHVYTVHKDSPAPAPTVEISPGYTVREETTSYIVHGDSSPSQVPTSTDHEPMCQQPDIGYVKSPGGILKIVEAVSNTVVR